VKRGLRLWPAVAILAAVALALLADGVLAAARDARSGASPGILARAGGTLIGVSDDRELRRALPLVQAAAEPGLSPGSAFRRRGLAAAALTRAAQSGPPAARARASHLLAALALRDAAVDRANARDYMGEAIRGFTAAARLDPRDDASKHDLELLLRLDGKRQRREDAGSGHDHGDGTRARGRSGSGSAAPSGRGY
jgi:hypothetical protein